MIACFNSFKSPLAPLFQSGVTNIEFCPVEEFPAFQKRLLNFVQRKIPHFEKGGLGGIFWCDNNLNSRQFKPANLYAF
jgi:hypothetical protein